MSENQGKSNNWAWIVGTGVAALAGVAVAAATIMNNQPAEYSPVPRRRVNQVTRPSRPGSSVSRMMTNTTSGQVDLEEDFDKASTASSEVDGQPQKSCRICFRRLSILPVEYLPCSHVFHEACVGKWMEANPHNKTCPICRISIN
ncbi:uncharacterized protein [Leptinotarsa decemlineata]|uniref:uncharacterized protein n=1 Tax=Leptinotarsa decemlineata TaxID=7539 RepID=UPI000C2520B8|nr:probable E3 ubiquitin-protein ligase ATL45 [Leptinotarsa decemlineata]